jgi:hypothetical protein
MGINWFRVYWERFVFEAKDVVLGLAEVAVRLTRYAVESAVQAAEEALPTLVERVKAAPGAAKEKAKTTITRVRVWIALLAERVVHGIYTRVDRHFPGSGRARVAAFVFAIPVCTILTLLSRLLA